jgi:hypothetical protein
MESTGFHGHCSLELIALAWVIELRPASAQWGMRSCVEVAFDTAAAEPCTHNADPDYPKPA